MAHFGAAVFRAVVAADAIEGMGERMALLEAIFNRAPLWGTMA